MICDNRTAEDPIRSHLLLGAHARMAEKDGKVHKTPEGLPKSKFKSFLTLVPKSFWHTWSSISRNFLLHCHLTYLSTMRKNKSPFPSSWKLPTVIPVFKNSDDYDDSWNNWPITNCLPAIINMALIKHFYVFRLFPIHSMISGLVDQLLICLHSFLNVLIMFWMYLMTLGLLLSISLRHSIG